MADEVWEARTDTERRVEPDTEIVLAFDGSYSRDSTVLIGATVEEHPHVFTVAVWERPPNDPRWRTPRREVADAIADAMARWRVLELAPDPHGWHREIEDWADIYGDTVVVFDTNQPSRMGPACDEFEQAVRNDGEMTHDGDPRLARHVANAVAVKRGPYVLVTKEARDSLLKIDAAVGAIIAYHRARWWFTDGDRDEEIGAFLIELPTV
jgi:hypothetical protein